MIQPMLAREALTIEEALSDVKDAWADEKLDGFRMILDTNGSRPLAYSRQGNIIVLPTYLMEAARLLPENSIFDGELIYSTGTQIQHRHTLQKKLNLHENLDQGDLHYAVFDVLQVEGHNVKDLSLDLRKDLIDYMLTRDRTAPVFCLMGGPVSLSNVDAVGGLFRIREGLVFKSIRSKYVPGKRVGFWKKVLNPEYGKVPFIGGAADRATRFAATGDTEILTEGMK